MNLLHAATVGTDDYHALMRAVLPHAWKAQAGYKPQVAPEAECSVPTLIYAGIYTFSAVDDYGYWCGDMQSIIVDVRACAECYIHLNKCYSTVNFRLSLGRYNHCDICGQECFIDDDIPF